MPFSLSLPLVFRLWALYILALGIYKLLGLPYCGTLLHLPLHLPLLPFLHFFFAVCSRTIFRQTRFPLVLYSLFQNKYLTQRSHLLLFSAYLMSMSC